MKKYKKGSRSGGLVMPFLSLMASKPLMVEKHNPLESTVHISHIAQHAVAGERHAFSLEEDRSQKTEYWHAETAETADPRHFERTSTGGRGKSRNPFMQNLTQKEQKQRKLPSFRAQRSGVEKSFQAEALRRERNLSQIAQITRIFLFYANQCPLMPAEAGWQISQSRTERKREQSRYQSAGWLALASTKCGRKICDNQRNLREMIS